MPITEKFFAEAFWIGTVAGADIGYGVDCYKR